MKRKVLFRGKRVDNGKWIEGYLVVNKDGTCWIKDTDYQVNNDKNDLIPHEVIPETIGQFTGLTDRNGVKIFEGDIVRYYQPYSQKWEEHIVLWDVNWASFGLFEQGSAYCKESDWVKIQHIEIIGNIHDNPELLK